MILIAYSFGLILSLLILFRHRLIKESENIVKTLNSIEIKNEYYYKKELKMPIIFVALQFATTILITIISIIFNLSDMIKIIFLSPFVLIGIKMIVHLIWDVGSISFQKIK